MTGSWHSHPRLYSFQKCDATWMYTIMLLLHYSSYIVYILSCTYTSSYGNHSSLHLATTIPVNLPLRHVPNLKITSSTTYLRILLLHHPYPYPFHLPPIPFILFPPPPPNSQNGFSLSFLYHPCALLHLRPSPFPLPSSPSIPVPFTAPSLLTSSCYSNGPTVSRRPFHLSHPIAESE